MHTRLTAITSLYRYSCFIKQEQRSECMRLRAELNAASEEYMDALNHAAEHGAWKSVEASEYIDLSRYTEALRYESAALEVANQHMAKMRITESELSGAMNESVQLDAKAKSIKRRMDSITHAVALTDEKRSFDQLCDLIHCLENT